MEKNRIKPINLGKSLRMTYSKEGEKVAQIMPNLIEIQKKSYEWFLNEGLGEVFRDISPIKGYSDNLTLEFVDFKISDKLKYTIEECKERDATFAAPLKVKVRLFDRDKVEELKEHEIFMGDLPLMTDTGTFVINGAERVIVSQLVRSPGIYYKLDHHKTGKELFFTQVIPNRGAWLEYETDQNNIFWVRVDRNKKVPITTLIRALGIGTRDGIISLFGEEPKILESIEKEKAKSYEEGLIELYKKIRPGEPPTVDSAEKLLSNMFFDDRRYDLAKVGRYKFNKKLAFEYRIVGEVLAQNVVDSLTGEIVAEKGEVITREKAIEIQDLGVDRVVLEKNDREVIVLSNYTVNIEKYIDITEEQKKNAGIFERVYYPMLLFLMREFKANNELGYLCKSYKRDDKDEKLKTFFKTYRDMSNDEIALLMEEIENLSGEELEAFIKLLAKNTHELVPKHITLEDIMASINYNLHIEYGIGNFDDIDHLQNRRIRAVGELLQNQFRIGLARMERVVKERMNTQEPDKISPQTLINIRPVTAAIKEFFGSSQLSQFMDQTNPLAELTHKRRLSALGPGGLSRDRAGFEVRDVHDSHYGRMCPIETPEGPNIGLINSLATYARINEYGFIEAPYRRVDKSGDVPVVTDEVVYMPADVEWNYNIAQANEPIDENGHFVNEYLKGRHGEDFIEMEAEKIDYMDVTPKMVFSVATAMIPFLENDDANRALMGSNMQRQAVPLLTTDSSIVGTGMEYKSAVDSGIVVVAKNAGTVKYVSADYIEIETDKKQIDRYNLTKFLRSNQGTTINQKPIVNTGEKVEVGTVIADGPSTSNGEIALGKNPLIGFMTWEGYNFEDAILISENLVKADTYTSLHIEEYEAQSRDTKLGAEEITKDVPGVGEDALKDLDERGIIRIGAEIRTGDILVGKVTPKGETELTAEEKLLRAIFGEKAREVRDTSLRVPHGARGIVVDVKVFTRENKDELPAGVNKSVRVYVAKKRRISVGDKMAGRHGNKGVISRILPQEDMPFLPNGRPLDIVLNPLGVPSRMNIGQVLEVHLGLAAKALGIKIATPVFDGASEVDIMDTLKLANDYVNTDWDSFKDKWESTLHEGLMSYLEENKDHRAEWKDVPIREDGKIELRDGRTGEYFDNPVTVGYMHYLKLHHLVEAKLHARSTGPYSLVTQQPLGGKAQFGGQRFGEMEVWALEAYGAAYTLQEILTMKSDDVIGRVKTYEAIIKGENIPEPGIPESFKVLLKELQSLSLDVKILLDDKEEVKIKEDLEDLPEVEVDMEGTEDMAKVTYIAKAQSTGADIDLVDEMETYNKVDDSEEDLEEHFTIKTGEEISEAPSFEETDNNEGFDE